MDACQAVDAELERIFAKFETAQRNNDKHIDETLRQLAEVKQAISLQQGFSRKQGLYQRGVFCLDGPLSCSVGGLGRPYEQHIKFTGQTSCQDCQRHCSEGVATT